MKGFIWLCEHDGGRKVAYRIDHIIALEPYNGAAFVTLTDGRSRLVTESVEDVATRINEAEDK